MEHFPLIDKLHTDVLEEKYGPISSRIVVHNTKIRKAHLIDKKGISRTFAITFLNTPANKEVSIINEEIKQGKPIGVAFREHDYTIRKNVLEVYKIKIPGWLKREFQAKGGFAKARLSEFYARKNNNKPIIYGIVVEIYSPDFREPNINKVDLSQESALSDDLEKQGFTKNEIWKRIGMNNNYSDSLKNFEIAKKYSKPKIKNLKKAIKTELSK